MGQTGKKQRTKVLIEIPLEMHLATHEKKKSVRL